jgi:hypothetical protein
MSVCGLSRRGPGILGGGLSRCSRRFIPNRGFLVVQLDGQGEAQFAMLSSARGGTGTAAASWQRRGMLCT